MELEGMGSGPGPLFPAGTRTCHGAARATQQVPVQRGPGSILPVPCLEQK